MSKVIYDAPGVVEARFDASKKRIDVVWHRFPGDGHFRPCLDAQAKLVASGQAKVVVVDVSHARGVPAQEDQAYLVETVFPAYRRGGLRAIVTVLPDSALTKLGAQRWQAAGSEFGFGMFEAASVTDVDAIVASLGKAA